MSTISIPDSDLLCDADRVTIWIASPPGPRDVWSLTDALAWATNDGRAKITLHRPARDGRRAVWVAADQVRRLASAVSSAAAQAA